MAVLLLGTLGLVAFGALSWIILMASVASVHALFDEATGSFASDIDGDDISDFLGLPWWMVWYHFLMLIAVGVLAAMGMVKQYASVLGNFLTALFALQMYVTHVAAVGSRAAADTESRIESRMNAFLAGSILSALSTALLIVWLGVAPAILPASGKSSQGQPPQVSEKQMDMNASYDTQPGAPVYGTPPPGVPQQQYNAPQQQYNAPQQHYNALSATGSSYGSGAAPQMPPPPPPPAPNMAPMSQEHGYSHPPPPPQGLPPPPAGATNYAQQ